MVLASLALVLALGPEARVEGPAPAHELPSWRELPEPAPAIRPAPAAKPPSPPSTQLVPSDGAGLITLGGILLATGATLGVTAIVQATVGDPRTTSNIAAIMTGPVLGAGIVTTSLGLVVRRQFRASPTAAIPDAPRIGSGMLLGGIGLIAGGTAFSAHALVDLTTELCSHDGATWECRDIRPIGAPIQLGIALAGVVVGTGLVIPGVRQRLTYRKWAKQRLQLQPSAGASRTSLSLGLAGRF